MSDKQELKPISEDVLDLSKKIQKALKIDKDGIGEIPKEVFLENMPEDVTEDQAKVFKGYHETFVAAVAHATGMEGTAHLKKHKDQDKATVKAHTLGRDYVTVNFQKQTESFNPRNRDEKIVKWGTLSVDVHAQAENKNAGQLAIVQSHLRSMAQEALADL